MNPDPSRRALLESLAALGCLSLSSVEAWAAGADPAVTAAATTIPSDAELGSLFPFIQSQVPPGPAAMSFRREGYHDLAAWKRAARAKLLDLLHYAPPPCEPRPEVVEKVDRGDHVRERVYFNTTPDLRVPAYVLIPKNARLPAPAIVALHDHGGFYLWGKEKLVETDVDTSPFMAKFKQTYYAGRSIATDLARRGYVVIVIDMFYWGERRLLLADDPPDWRDRPRDVPAERVSAFNKRSSQNEELLGRTIYSAGFTWSGVMYWDDVRTVDYLVSRPEVDKSRIGCVGLSVGGLRSCHLAALDERIKAAVIVGWMTSFPHQLRHHVRTTIGYSKLVPGLYRHLDYPDVATLAMPAALLVINGTQDKLFAPDGVKASFQILHDAYAKAGIPEKVRTRMYDTPHEFNAAMQAEAWEWLSKWV
jgi:dienelactone hydrolase